MLEMSTMIELMVSIAYLTGSGAFASTLAGRRGLDKLSWFAGGFFFPIVSHICLTVMPVKPVKPVEQVEQGSTKKKGYWTTPCNEWEKDKSKKAAPKETWTCSCSAINPGVNNRCKNCGNDRF